ncbi:hypothetical protein GJ744_004527 [Endocarpon pusillum]|uniref:Uncharacterized protein n=1 Tax=Endocarpon pusillum TaxID=364733 RepID=A0A8H7ATR6_9EURO|nr:hypothetical protein GJ744_004527 [Endocarpon pusillum]
MDLRLPPPLRQEYACMLTSKDASGKAVTAFPTEYRYREEAQEAQFVIKAECFNDSEMDCHIQELLDEYRQPYMASANELPEAEYKVAEDKSHAAKQVFETVFGNTEMFFHDTGEHYNDLDLNLETMKDESEGAYDRILLQLQHLSRTLKWPEDMVDGIWEDKTATAERVSELLQPWIDSGLWVFVKIARIYLESDLLKAGIVFADLPGYHDVNFARVSAAKKYQATCEEIFVISDIKRAIDDPVIEEVIKDHCRRFTDVGQLTRPRITVVCTHSGKNGDMKDLEKHVSKDLLDEVKDQERRLSSDGDKLSVAEWKEACAEVELKLIRSQIPLTHI